MNPLAILELLNAILALTPNVITMVDKIRTDVTAGNSDPEVLAMLDQIDANHAAMLLLLGGK